MEQEKQNAPGPAQGPSPAALRAQIPEREVGLRESSGAREMNQERRDSLLVPLLGRK